MGDEEATQKGYGILACSAIYREKKNMAEGGAATRAVYWQKKTRALLQASRRLTASTWEKTFFTAQCC